MNEIKNKTIIIPGASKCGTSTLYWMMTRSNEVCEIYLKEPTFFCFPEKIVKDNLNLYMNLFRDTNKTLIDASTYYLYCERAARNIKKYVKNPKILIIIRDPAERLFSIYLHQHKLIPSEDKRNFDLILRQLFTQENRNLIELELENLKLAEKKGLIDINGSIKKNKKFLMNNFNLSVDLVNFLNFHEVNFFKNNIFLQLRYFQESMFSNFIKIYRNYFSDLKVIFFEKLLNNPVETIKEVCEFLDIKYDTKMSTLPHMNKTILPYKYSRIILRTIQKFATHEIFSKLHFLRPLFYSNKPKMTRSQYNITRSLLKNEYDFWFNKYPELVNIWKYDKN